MGLSGQLHASAGRFIPRERTPGIHYIGDCVGPRASLDAVVRKKFLAPIIQPHWASYPGFWYLPVSHL